MFKLLLHAIQIKVDQDHDEVHGPCSEEGPVTIGSTKFEDRFIQIGQKGAGSFIDEMLPPEWCGICPSKNLKKFRSMLTWEGESRFLASGLNSEKEVPVIN